MKTKTTIWVARIMSILVIIFMLFDSVSKLLKAKQVISGTLQLGFLEHHIVIIGILGLIPTLLYAFPSTSILGAILLTGYLGGAIVTNLRVDAPLFTNILFPVYLALFMWGGLWLRDEKLRNLFPLKRKQKDIEE
ncbi:DoxX-like family protein [Seinonella peptonophila]|uniref:DoxX-like family protein n=1 Tax=Seinonella peptonophila TaxID=112248 RepID=A0A1M4SMX4_9BACL|nr:DoxX-like family protein [Seinonella peptonophila]